MADVLKFDDLPSDNQAPQSFDNLVDDSQKHDTAFGHVASASLGALNTMTLGLGGKGLEKLGVTPEFQRELRESNPVSYGIGNVAGLLTGPVGEAIGAGGKAIQSLAGNGIAGTASKLATEAALFQTTDEVTKAIQSDPNQSIQTAAINVGLSGLLGGAFGAVGGVAGKGVQKIADSKVGEWLNDFRNRVIEHTAPETSPSMVSNPDYMKAMTPESVDAPMFMEGQAPKPEMSYENLSPGAKAADLFVQSKLSGQGAGAMLGGGLGHATGIPFAGMIGAGVGGKVIGPTLDAIIKPVVNGVLSGEGFEAASKFINSVVKGDNSLSKASKAVFDAGMDVLPSKTGQDERESIKDALKMAQDAPQSILNAGGPLHPYMPSHNVALGQLTGNAVQYLSSIEPKAGGGMNPLDTKIPPSKAQESNFNRALDIANQPLTLMQHIKDGTLMSHDLNTLMAIYPTLHAKMAQSLTNSMINHRSNGGIIPYKTKAGLSMFLGQPLDSTLTPTGIQAAQSVYAPKQQPQQPSATKKGTAPLTKLSSSYQTAEQSREARKNK